ncbi:Manganese/iron superoxide dismutase [Artemisia annua]|uniref:Superoxide dismutase n=1 Tax=Artemisia annua TaxID=35608 RepID=A0A2U1LRV6_ARTAN|nr:Manganese/iron superoxide dismutase [Artemisia annua]
MSFLRTLTTRTKTLKTLYQSHQQARGLQTLTLPDLPYDYGSLEPAISGEIMQIHHQKHHQTYVTNYNKAIEQLDVAIANGDASSAVKLHSAVNFNGGEKVVVRKTVKHQSLIHKWAKRKPTTVPSSLSSYGNALMTCSVHLAFQIWPVIPLSWLALDKDFKRLVVETTANQDPLVTKGPNLVPLVGIDVWEHAYYLQYKNVRPDYLKNIWKVINWKYASDLYEMECP